MRTSLISLLVLVLSAAIAVSPVKTEPHAQTGKLKNIKVLTDLSETELNTEMQNWVKALGVRCSFCHQLNDYAADDNEHKDIARKMATMVRSVNSQFFQSAERKVRCVVCHRGVGHGV